MAFFSGLEKQLSGCENNQSVDRINHASVEAYQPGNINSYNSAYGRNFSTPDYGYPQSLDLSAQIYPSESYGNGSSFGSQYNFDNRMSQNFGNGYSQMRGDSSYYPSYGGQDSGFSINGNFDTGFPGGLRGSIQFNPGMGGDFGGSIAGGGSSFRGLPFEGGIGGSMSMPSLGGDINSMLPGGLSFGGIGGMGGIGDAGGMLGGLPGAGMIGGLMNGGMLGGNLLSSAFQGIGAVDQMTKGLTSNLLNGAISFAQNPLKPVQDVLQDPLSPLKNIAGVASNPTKLLTDPFSIFGF